MAYLNPTMVVSPKSRINELNVIYDGKENGYSIALMKWEGKDGVGVRWNGKDDYIGTPQSRGIATWFILPVSVATPYLEALNLTPDISLSSKKAIEKYLASNDKAGLV